jgi:hypothetical protein
MSGAYPQRASEHTLASIVGRPDMSDGTYWARIDGDTTRPGGAGSNDIDVIRPLV